jgi:hypothetical protein
MASMGCPRQAQARQARLDKVWRGSAARGATWQGKAGLGSTGSAKRVDESLEANGCQRSIFIAGEFADDLVDIALTLLDSLRPTELWRCFTDCIIVFHGRET